MFEIVVHRILVVFSESRLIQNKLFLNMKLLVHTTSNCQIDDRNHALLGINNVVAIAKDVGVEKLVF